jgi:hypothetical protein
MTLAHAAVELVLAGLVWLLYRRLRASRDEVVALRLELGLVRKRCEEQGSPGRGASRAWLNEGERELLRKVQELGTRPSLDGNRDRVAVAAGGL